MPEELFRTPITSRDPRHASITTLCSYSMAGIFLGMFLTLSGVMLTSIDHNELQNESERLNNIDTHLHRPVSEQNSRSIFGLDNSKNKDKDSFRQFFGLILLILGCLLIVISLILLMFTSLLYLRTTTRPPNTNEIDPEPNTVWNYLDSIDNTKQIEPEMLLKTVNV